MTIANAQTFTAGKFNYKVVDATNKYVEITSGDDYDGATSADFVAEVTNEGQTYKVVGVGASAFEWVEFGGDVALPEGIQYIGKLAFNNACGGKFTVPASLTNFVTNAFIQNQFQKFEVNGDNPNFATVSTTQEGCEYVFLTDKTKKRVLVAPGVVYKDASEENYVETVVIPESITEIGACAFNGNPTVTQVTFHNGITYYGDNAFENTWLTSANIPNGNAYFGIALFQGSPDLETVTLGAGIKELTRTMFNQCNSLESITLPEGITKLGKQSLCKTALTSIDLPSTCELIDSSALQWITDLKSIDLKNVKRINAQAMGNMTFLATITGGDKVEVIENAAFIRDNALKQMPAFPALKEMYGTPFFNCTGLTDVTVPASLVTCDVNPFVNCTKLTEIKVAEGAANYGAYDGCLYETKDGKPYRLVSYPTAREDKVMVMQPGAEVVGQQALRYAPITDFISESGLKTTENLAFAACSALTNVELPESTTDIANPAFSQCAKITSVKVMAVNPPTISGAFNAAVYSNATLTVPAESVQAYQGADVWKDFQNIVGAQPTSIDDVKIASESTYKVIENGQVIIVKGNTRYNIMGQEIK